MAPFTAISSDQRNIGQRSILTRYGRLNGCWKNNGRFIAQFAICDLINYALGKSMIHHQEKPTRNHGVNYAIQSG